MVNSLIDINKKFSVAGYEAELTDYIINEVKDFCDECYKDKIGNVICHKKGKGEKLLLNTSVSSFGIFVNTVDSIGRIKFNLVGKCDTASLIGKKVRNAEGKEIGIILSEDNKEDLKPEDLYIDTGAFSKEEVLKNISVGEVLEVYDDTSAFGDNIYGMKLSQTVGIYSLIKLIKTVKSDYDLYLAFSVMDNLGFKGARTAAFAIAPDYCITVSGADTANKNTPVKLSEGVCIRIKDSHIIVNKKMRDSLVTGMASENIPFQLEILDKDGLTNNEIMYLRNGILTANINCPVKGLGTVCECVNRKDIDNLVKALCCFVKSK